MVIRIKPAAAAVAVLLIILTIATTAFSAGGREKTPSKASSGKAQTAIGTKPTEKTPEEPPTEADEDFTPRYSAPSEDNICYYSEDNIFYASGYGMPNCTCYAWGRAYELSGKKPELSPYDACTWYEYNVENEVYDYGNEPREGAIACFEYADGGSGHVAVVEEVGEDSIILSNSAYSGIEFYTESVPADDPANGRENWIFQGYIYI